MLTLLQVELIRRYLENRRRLFRLRCEWTILLERLRSIEFGGKYRPRNKALRFTLRGDSTLADLRPRGPVRDWSRFAACSVEKARNSFRNFRPWFLSRQRSMETLLLNSGACKCGT